MLSRVQAFTCPCCGGFIGEAAPINAVLDAIPTGAQHIIIDQLARRLGSHVRRQEIVNAVYPRHRPANPEQNVAVYINRMRKRLASYGWSIVTRNQATGVETAYRLIPMEAGQ